jgi:spermidine synthase
MTEIASRSSTSGRNPLASIWSILVDLGRLQGPTVESAPRLRGQLFLTSFIILYFELICIRWIPAYVRYLSYFTNFILLAVFLGSGAGILAGKRQKLWLPPFPLLVFTLVVTVAFTKFEFIVPSPQMLYFGAGEAAAQTEQWISLPIIFILVALCFVPLARPLARLLTALPPLEAYLMDILGSLAGIGVFFLLSYFSLPPLLWFLILSLAFLLLLPVRQAILLIPFLLAVLFLVFRLSEGNFWSPYYRIQVFPTAQGSTVLNVNNISHQKTVTYTQKETFYFRAYDLLGTPPFQRVLILGSGTGCDVAIALHNGAAQVDAVEIDPVIYDLGMALNPDHPYADPRVSVFINDGRAFLRNTANRYDLIVFALPDSLTLTSGFSSLRLESFLLSTEAIRSARDHLSENGLAVLYNYYRQDWLVEKLAGMVETVFDTPPFVTTYGAWGRAAVIMNGPRLHDLDPELQKPYAELAVPTESQGRGYPLPVVGQGLLGAQAGQALATDDWPFIYLSTPTVPSIFLVALAGVLVFSVLFVYLSAPHGTLRSFNWHFFFLGAAFMLLETRSLVTFSLLFGSTWMINSLVFFAILSSVLLAILFNTRIRVRRIGWLYGLLFAALTLNVILPLDTLLRIPGTEFRYLIASALTFAPIFLANVVFSHSFRDSRAADIAFGSNLLGIVAGGMLEYLALMAGYRFLLLPVIIFYAIALLLWMRTGSYAAAFQSSK